jgi:hypothetical protein
MISMSRSVWARAESSETPIHRLALNAGTITETTGTVFIWRDKVVPRLQVFQLKNDCL